MVGIAAILAALAVWLALPPPSLRRLAGRPAGYASWGRRRAARSGLDGALVAELLAATLAGGLAVPQALRSVAAAGEASGLDTDGQLAAALDLLAGAAAASAPVAQLVPAPLRPVAEAVEFAMSTGAPVVPLLVQAATVARRRRRDAGVRASGRLAASLVLPLGLCALPGFLLLGVAPVVVRLVSSLN